MTIVMGYWHGADGSASRFAERFLLVKGQSEHFESKGQAYAIFGKQGA